MKNETETFQVHQHPLCGHTHDIDYGFVGLMRNYGFGEDWFLKFLKAWSVMLPVAYVSAFLIIPSARKFAEKITVIK